MNQQLKGKKRDRCFVLSHKSSREVTEYCWRVSCVLLTQRRDPFAIQRQIKRGIDHATWMTRLSYLPSPGNRQLPPNASKHRQFFGSVQTECLCQNFQLEQILQSIQTRFVPGEINIHSFRTGTATSNTSVGLPGDRIRGARKWHCDLM